MCPGREKPRGRRAEPATRVFSVLQPISDNPTGTGIDSTYHHLCSRPDGCRCMVPGGGVGSGSGRPPSPAAQSRLLSRREHSALRPRHNPIAMERDGRSFSSRFDTGTRATGRFQRNECDTVAPRGASRAFDLLLRYKTLHCNKQS